MRNITMTGLFMVLLFIGQGVLGQKQAFDDLVNAGIQLHDEGAYDAAIQKYKEALMLNPKSSLVLYELSYSYLAKSDYKQAEKYSKRVIQMKDDQMLSGYITYGSALDLQGKTKKSIKAYEEAMQYFDHYLLYYNHAISCYNLGDDQKAGSSAIKAIHNYPSHASSHLILSKIMDAQGSRVKAMLPLYFFLLIEPGSQRAAIEYKTMRAYHAQGISAEGNHQINVNVNTDSDADFGAAELMLSLSNVANTTELGEGKTDLELFAENNDRLFKILGELKKENTGFWWDFYVPFFDQMAQENLTETYTYYISQSLGDAATNWLTEHPDEFKQFKAYIGQ